MEATRRNIRIPSALRSVSPFLEEAQAVLSHTPLNDGNRRVAIFCIDHAFALIKKVDIPLDDDCRLALDQFAAIREDLIKNLSTPLESGKVSPTLEKPYLPDPGSESREKVLPEEVLIAEANETLELAEQQFDEGMNDAAARNFHTATVYFRVLESIVPHLSHELHAKLEYAACRTRQCAHLLHNFVHEHFEGKKCSDYYDIFTDKRIGKGSYGSVYLCRHKKTGDEFACKVINVNRINSHYLRKLHLEIEIMKEVDHPNIIKLRGVFFGQRTVCLVMELCKGGELFDQLTGSPEHKRGFSEPYAARMLQDMFSSILYLHNHGIVHRDLKLENFLFEDKSIHSPLKLIDFGLSKHFTAHEHMRQVVGSAYYTAPEVLQGSYDQRCDVWSLGVVGYMLLSGCPPFFGSNSDAIHDMILTEEPDFSSKRFSHVSSIALDFLQKLLVKDATQRLTPAQALQHPFIQLASSPMGSVPATVEAHSDVASSLKSFVQMSRFKKLILELVAFSLTSGQITNLREDFNSIDKDRSGTISIVELQASMQHVQGATKEYVEEIFQSVDIDQSAEINYNEFVAAAMCRRITIDEERLMLAFETLDIDNTGYLDAKSIRRALGNQMTEDEIKEMLNEVDLNQDGKIDYMEFVGFWRELIIKTKLTPLQKFLKAVRRLSQGMRAINIMKRATFAAAKRSTVHPDGDNNSDERRATVAENGTSAPSPANASARAKTIADVKPTAKQTGKISPKNRSANNGKKA